MYVKMQVYKCHEILKQEGKFFATISNKLTYTSLAIELFIFKGDSLTPYEVHVFIVLKLCKSLGMRVNEKLQARYCFVSWFYTIYH